MFIETQDVEGCIVLINPDAISFVVKVHKEPYGSVAKIYTRGNWWTMVSWETLHRDWNWRRDGEQEAERFWRDRIADEIAVERETYESYNRPLNAYDSGYLDGVDWAAQAARGVPANDSAESRQLRSTNLEEK